MFFYLVKFFESSVRKIGITRRLPKYRLEEYRTADVEVEYYAVAYFNNLVYDDLLEMEKCCLFATKEYGRKLKEYPSNETRYYIEHDILWNICAEYFPANTVIYKNNDDILKLSYENCPNAINTPGESKINECFKTYNELHNYKPIKPIKMVDLRGYQIELYPKLREILAEHKIATLSIMCRCGKTELFKRYAYENSLRFNYIIYCANRLPLITEMIERFDKMLPEFRYVELSSNNNSRYFTKKDIIGSIIEKHQHMLIFVCNDSFSYLREFLLNADKTSLIIFDEAHHLSSPKKPDSPLVLLNDWKRTANIRTEVIYATATPIYGNYFIHKDYIYMNDPEYFGNTELNTLCFNDIELAIKQEFMTPAVLVIGDYYNDNVEDGKNSNDNQFTDYVVLEDKNSELVINSSNARINNAINLFTNVCKTSLRKKTLFYCNDMKTVKECYSMLDGIDGFKIFKLISDMTPNDRINSLEEFRKCLEPCIMVNCQMVTDGINIPDIDTVLYVDPKYSKANIIQSSMRPRSYDKKNPDKVAYIIVPHFAVDKTSADFEIVITIIRELHTNHDPSVSGLFNIVSCKSKKSDVLVDNKITKNIVINENLQHLLINLIREEFVPEYDLTLYDAIIKTTSIIPKTCRQILDDIIKNKYCTRYNNTIDINECYKCCEELVRNHVLEFNNKYNMYYVGRRNSKISTKDFVKLLIDMNIADESSYREKYHGYYDAIYPVCIEDVYKDFSWDMLNVSVENRVEYTLDEFRGIINTLLLNNEIAEKIKMEVSAIRKMDILRKYDNNLLPYEVACKKYNVKLHELHKIFGVIAQRMGRY